MIRQGFYIGERDWWIMVYYNIATGRDIGDIADVLVASGAQHNVVNEACDTLSQRNTGFTFSNLREHSTVICISHATSFDEMFSTINHEIKHCVEHISSYYGVEPTSERAAYLQGEISRQMYKAVALAICPRCNSH